VADLLQGVTVIESSMYAPDALGGHLADLGAEVIKVEQPGGAGFRGILFPHGHIQNMQWNRGKKSVVIDLKLPEGQELFRQLAKHADVVIDGMRHGAAERLGYSYDDIVAVNPKIVYCVLNGMGNNSPYADLATHGLSFDCFAGLNPPLIMPDGTPRIPGLSAGQVGVNAGPLHAGMAVLAALYAAQRDGTAKYVEVAEVDAAITWGFERVTSMASGIRYDDVGIHDSLTYQYYETSDGNYVVFNALEDKFWRRFCTEIGRDDLYDLGHAHPSTDPAGHEKLRIELTEIFKSRTRSEWTRFFIDTNIAGAPAFLDADLLDDPHVKARNLVYEQPSSVLDTTLRMMRTPIKTEQDGPPPTVAPEVGQHTDAVLGSLLGYDHAELDRLRADGVIASEK
jgi:crotonobetainyl-CoA:carnitine CoA-transferase CaiB-like acyl-CoA transferase